MKKLSKLLLVPLLAGAILGTKTYASTNEPGYIPVIYAPMTFGYAEKDICKPTDYAVFVEHILTIPKLDDDPAKDAEMKEFMAGEIIQNYVDSQTAYGSDETVSRIKKMKGAYGLLVGAYDLSDSNGDCNGVVSREESDEFLKTYINNPGFIAMQKFYGTLSHEDGAMILDLFENYMKSKEIDYDYNQ